MFQVTSYGLTADIIRDLAHAHELPTPSNVEALARMATGTLINFVREAEIYGSDMTTDSEQLIDAWVDVVHTYLRRT